MREAADLTQQQAAEYLGLLSHQTISNWEVDRKPPSARSLLDLWRWYEDLVEDGRFTDEFPRFFTDEFPGLLRGKNKPGQ